MEIKDIIDYVEKTPCNSNPNVLETMLEELSGGGGEALKSASVYYFRASEGYQGDIPEGAAKMNIFFEDGETWSELIASDENPIVGFLDTYEYGKLFSVYNAYVLAQYLYMWSTYNSYVYKGNNVGTSTMIAPTDTIEDGGVYYFADFPGEDCMVAGSMISTSGKKADIDVIDIKVGDEIASLDPNTLEMTTAIVNEVKQDHMPESRKTADHWFKFVFDDGNEIHLTGMHRFFNVETGKFEWLQNFNVGDRAYRIDGTMPRLVSVERIDEKVRWNTFWNVDKANYFCNGFLSGNITSPIPNIKG